MDHTIFGRANSSAGNGCRTGDTITLDQKFVEELTPEEVLQVFLKTFVHVNHAHVEMGYSPQYCRRLILQKGTDEESLFRLDGRIYVTRTFLNDLRA